MVALVIFRHEGLLVIPGTQLTNGRRADADEPPPTVSHQTPVPRLLLPPREAAQALAMSEIALWEMTDRGEIPRVRIGNCKRYSIDQLGEWIARQSTEDS
jgi:hypothetical protein